MRRFLLDRLFSLGKARGVLCAKRQRGSRRITYSNEAICTSSSNIYLQNREWGYVVIAWMRVTVLDTAIEIDRSTNGGAWVTVAPSLGLTVTGFPDTGLTSNTEYRYRLSVGLI